MAYRIFVPNYGEAIKQIARMVGHPIPADPAGSSDPAVLQMGAAINVGLGELVAMHEWQDLTKQGTTSVIQDAPGQKEKSFPLPEDYHRLVSQTEWSSGSMLPAFGPISSQAWISYVVRNYAMQLTLYWQIRNDKIWFLNPPAAAVNFEFMYISNAQVVDADDSTLLKNIAEKNGDKFLLDGFVVALFGRLKYLEWKGFDASAAARDFWTAYGSRTGSDKGAPVLSLSRTYGTPLIGHHSLPDTGYGLAPS